MDPNARAFASYGDATGATKSPRQVEYQAFAKITKALSRSAANHAAASPEEAPKRFPDLAAALHENLRLWSVVLTSVVSDANALPAQLRASLAYLADFTRDHTRKVLRGEADAAALIDVNTAVMRGLRQKEEATPCPV